MSDFSLYIHVPYCRHKCIYCDFYSGGMRIADWKRLCTAYLTEIKSRVTEFCGDRLVSIYLGGGTPSIMPPEYIKFLLQELRDIIGEDNIIDDCEITLEVNPEDVTKKTVATWKRIGINRVSVGIQTFNDRLLQSIGRRHTGKDAITSMQLLTREFKNVNGDLIFGLPGQSIEDLRHDIATLTKLAPQHISAYSLMYENGTALTLLRDKGMIQAVEEGIVESMFGEMVRLIYQVGYSRYETSNFSLPGFESRHNLGYWNGRKYIGIGPAAHSFDGIARRSFNPPDVKRYILHYSQATECDKVDSYIMVCEELSRTEQIEEMIMLQLRMKSGLDLDKFREKFGNEEMQALLRRAGTRLINGMIELSESRLRIPDRYVLISDSIIADLLP